MKKVLIISYFFPPGNFAGSYRILSWAKYLNKFGYYPIIITRKWEHKINDFKDMSKPSSEGVEHCFFDNYEVFYLPYKGNLRDRLYSKYGDTKYKALRKLLTFGELLFQNFFNGVIPFRNIYTFSYNYLKKNRDINIVIASGKPYILFRFCYLLSKRLNINWVADYRDEWCSSQWNKDLKGIKKLIHKLETRSEKKWVGSANFITSVSDFWMQSISSQTNKKGYVVMNGYDEDDYKYSTPDIYFDEFTIIYNGTLYYTQPVEVFLDGFKIIADEFRDRIKVRICFHGLSIDPNRTNQVIDYLKGYEDHYLITGRLPKNDVIDIQFKSHLLLMVSHTDIKGTHSSKIFEYLACKKPVMICPSDNDVLEEIIQKTKAGFICNNKEDVVVLLRHLVSEFLSTKKILFNSNISEIEAFTRKNQTKILSDIFNKIPVTEKIVNKNESPNLNSRDKIFKILYKSSINDILYRKNVLKKNIIILCFHNISEHKSISYPHLNTRVFETLIKYIVKHYNVVPIEEIGTSEKNNKPSIVITFDDGYMDFYENALPILVKYKLPALNNVIVESVETGKPFWSLELNSALDFIFNNDCYMDFSKLGIKLKFQYQDKQNFEQVSIKLLKQLSTLENINRTVFIDALITQLKKFGYSSENLLMNWDNLSSCISNGVSVGSHTMSHDSLTSIKDSGTLEKELVFSKELLEQKLKTKVNALAFPNGFYNESIINHAKNHYKYLLNTKESYYNPVTDDQSNYFLLPRVSMNKRTFEENVLKLNNFHSIVKFNF